jgi:hypothetical protein
MEVWAIVLLPEEEVLEDWREHQRLRAQVLQVLKEKMEPFSKVSVKVEAEEQEEWASMAELLVMLLLLEEEDPITPEIRLCMALAVYRVLMQVAELQTSNPEVPVELRLLP